MMPSEAAQCAVFYEIVAFGFDMVMSYVNGAGVNMAAADVDAVRLMASTGNLSAGIFQLYGLEAA